MAKFLVELPINILPPFIFCCISYFLVGLNPDPARFVIFFLIVMMHAVTGVAFGLAIGAAVPTVEVATGMGPPLMIIMVLFGGFFMYVGN